MKPPPWLQSLRDAMSGSIKGDDLQSIMQAQVDKAKEGDMRAASFVFNQAHKLMAAQAQQAPPVTIVQNNYYDAPRPDAPIEPADDPADLERKRRSRVRAGLPLTTEADRRVRPVSDDEERELRRRQQAEEDEANARGPEGD
ncbi:MAG: hypothetical protein JWO31_3777 [Phycisphaerales bacterium]|nr:hypothetical protein [Phycisphaerales bacterium]